MIVVICLGMYSMNCCKRARGCHHIRSKNHRLRLCRRAPTGNLQNNKSGFWGEMVSHCLNLSISFRNVSFRCDPLGWRPVLGGFFGILGWPGSMDIQKFIDIFGSWRLAGGPGLYHPSLDLSNPDSGAQGVTISLRSSPILAILKSPSASIQKTKNTESLELEISGA